MRRSGGGLTTKIQTVVEASGLLLCFPLSPEKNQESTLAWPLRDVYLPPENFVLGDKAYNVEWIRATIEAQDAVSIIYDPQYRHHVPRLQPGSLSRAQPGRALFRQT